MPYLLFSQTNMQGRFQSFACPDSQRPHYDANGRQAHATHHVERLEDLALVGRAVAVHRERRVLPAEVLLREGETGAERDLRADDAVPTLEGLGEDVHGAALALGDAADAAEELADEALDVAAAEDDEGVRAV